MNMVAELYSYIIKYYMYTAESQNNSCRTCCRIIISIFFRKYMLIRLSNLCVHFSVCFKSSIY